MRAWRLTVLVLLTISGLLVGCTRMGPDYERPNLDIKTPSKYRNAADEKPAEAIDDRWWEAFGDPALNKIVERALARNWDIRQAASRVLELQAGWTATRADRFPSLSVSGEAKLISQASTTVTRTSLTSPPDVRVRLTQTESYSLALASSFELDLWGKLARLDEAARAELLAAEENRLTVRQTVVAETVSKYFEMESLERRLAIARASVDRYQRSYEFLDGRYRRGLSDILAVRQSRRALAQAESQLPGLRQQLGAVQHQLSILMGDYPQSAAERPQPEDYYRRMEAVPPGLPSDLLRRRPDVRAAEASLTAANARIGAAKAARFPAISLTGSYGYRSTELGELFMPQSELWNLAFNILGPIFNAGKLTANQRRAEALYQQTLAQYAKTVLQAFGEVETALLTRKEQLERRERVLVFLEEARAAQDVAENRYLRGLVGYLNVLEAQQARYSAEESLVLVDLAIMSNRVALYRALGGGWGDVRPSNSPDNS
jgi:multidrug efflux system outer membrane protein